MMAASQMLSIQSVVMLWYSPILTLGRILVEVFTFMLPPQVACAAVKCIHGEMAGDVHSLCFSLPAYASAHSCVAAEKQAANAAGVTDTRWMPLMKIWQNSGITQHMYKHLGHGISFFSDEISTLTWLQP